MHGTSPVRAMPALLSLCTTGAVLVYMCTVKMALTTRPVPGVAPPRAAVAAHPTNPAGTPPAAMTAAQHAAPSDMAKSYLFAFFAHFGARRVGNLNIWGFTPALYEACR